MKIWLNTELLSGSIQSKNFDVGHNMKVDNSSIKRVEEFKYLGTTFNKSKFYSGRN